MFERLGPAEFRARLVRAARIYEARLIAGRDPGEETIEAEAGAILEAQTAIDIGRLVEIGEWFKESWSK